LYPWKVGSVRLRAGGETKAQSRRSTAGALLSASLAVTQTSLAERTQTDFGSTTGRAGVGT